MSVEKTKNTYKICITRSFKSDANSILNLFKDGTVFKLTGANEIQSDYNRDGKFELIFKNRGKIFGKFVQISENEVILIWNVEGFNRPPEINTILKITLLQNGENCDLTLEHSDIVFKDAADAKLRAWTEILNEIENNYLKRDK